MFWIAAIIVILFLTLGLLAISAMEDFWQIVTFRMGFERLVGDLFHVLLVLGVGVVAEIFAFYMLIFHR
jgi:accessory gene regulator protein AgrB